MTTQEIEKILAGYDTDDFSLVETSNVPISDNEPESHVSTIHDERLDHMEQKLDRIYSMLAGVTPEYVSDIEKLEQLIMPLLVKLSKGDQEYIKWPNRSEQITRQIEKILTITRKYLTNDESPTKETEKGPTA